MLEDFRRGLAGPGRIARLQGGLIGDDAMLQGPKGPVPLIYADYAASGRALCQVEDFIRNQVLPYYANSHTEASFCGSQMTALRKQARQAVARSVNADDQTAVIFTGSGATAGLNRLVHLFGVDAEAAMGGRPVVFVGPYEHHSNILPWRESGAEVIEIDEDKGGGPDLKVLEAALSATSGRKLRIGSFSAASNVTGVVTDVDIVTAMLKRHGALAVWDYAAGAPYLTIDMSAPAEALKDAVVISPHKFVGGPGASGVLAVRRSSVVRSPVWPGGGTVSFVSPWQHVYSGDLQAREEAGTPNVLGDIRAGLAFMVKDAIGQDFIDRRGAELTKRAAEAWRGNPRLRLLGSLDHRRVPIFSFQVLGEDGSLVHHQLFTRMLSDLFGIQARGGCACAGPYAHRLLGIGQKDSEILLGRIGAGEELAKPGWVRLNFSYLLSDEKADAIIAAVDDLSREMGALAGSYVPDRRTAIFSHAPDALTAV